MSSPGLLVSISVLSGCSPPEVLEKRKKLIPVMLKERQENKKAYIVGDKLFVNGTLWKE
jgi:hypothetical protein